MSELWPRRWSECPACSIGLRATIELTDECYHDHPQAVLHCGDPAKLPNRYADPQPPQIPGLFSCDEKMVPFITYACSQGWYPWVSCQGGPEPWRPLYGGVKAYIAFTDKAHADAALEALPPSASFDPPHWPDHGLCIRIPPLDMWAWRPPS